MFAEVDAKHRRNVRCMNIFYRCFGVERAWKLDGFATASPAVRWHIGVPELVVNTTDYTVESCMFLTGVGVHNGLVLKIRHKSFADLTLKSKNKEFKFASTILTEDTPTILAPPPVLSFTRSKNIVKTAVDGSDSEVIECFGCKSWDITISGILVDLDEHSYPSDRVQRLRELFEINDILEVIDCKIMDDLNIQSLYLNSIDELKFVDGYNDTMSYKLKAYSIKPLEFFIL